MTGSCSFLKEGREERKKPPLPSPKSRGKGDYCSKKKAASSPLDEGRGRGKKKLPRAARKFTAVASRRRRRRQRIRVPCGPSAEEKGEEKVLHSRLESLLDLHCQIGKKKKGTLRCSQKGNGDPRCIGCWGVDLTSPPEGRGERGTLTIRIGIEKERESFAVGRGAGKKLLHHTQEEKGKEERGTLWKEGSSVTRVRRGKKEKKDTAFPRRVVGFTTKGERRGTVLNYRFVPIKRGKVHVFPQRGSYEKGGRGGQGN